MAAVAARYARPAVASRPTTRKAVVVRAQAQKQSLAQAAVATVAAAMLVAAPAFAAQDLKKLICPGNPTAEICLKGSAKAEQASEEQK